MVNDLAHRQAMKPGSAEYGAAFKHFIFMELRAHSSYGGGGHPIAYWRTTSGYEVDFILGNGNVAIEVKSGDHITTDHLKGLRAWKEEQPKSRCILVSRVPRARVTEDKIEIMPWKLFLEKLWAGQIAP